MHLESLTYVRPHRLRLAPTSMYRCPHCWALIFSGERINGHYRCCRSGKIQLPLPEAPPEPLLGYLSDVTPDSRFYRKWARTLNNALSMASMDAKVDKQFMRGGANEGGVHQFRIQGQLRHRMGALEPADEKAQLRFLQLWTIVDQADRLGQRVQGLNLSVDPGQRLLRELETMLIAVENPLVTIFQTAKQQIAALKAQAAQDGRPDREFRLVLTEQGADGRPVDRRVYNKPTADEVAVFVAEDAEQKPRGVVVRTKCGYVQTIDERSPFYDSLRFPLLLPSGELGWRIGTCFKVSTSLPGFYITLYM